MHLYNLIISKWWRGDIGQLSPHSNLLFFCYFKTCFTFFLKKKRPPKMRALEDLSICRKGCTQHGEHSPAFSHVVHFLWGWQLHLFKVSHLPIPMQMLHLNGRLQMFWQPKPLGMQRNFSLSKVIVRYRVFVVWYSRSLFWATFLDFCVRTQSSWSERKGIIARKVSVTQHANSNYG